MSTFTELVRQGAPAEDIAAHLDDLPPQLRVRQCLDLPGRLLEPLYTAAQGRAELEVATFVKPVRETLVYELKNSLAVFNVSQKRFYRPRQGDVVGYNHTTGLARLAGPGYFYTIDGDDGELVFDYTRLPDLQPPGWPAIRPNTGLVAGATYGDMIDYVRSVSRDTLVGAAYRRGKAMNAYFLLTRSAAQSA